MARRPRCAIRINMFRSGLPPKRASPRVWGEARSVSSHNDTLPANILFDGKRLWMIDWESAYRTGLISRNSRESR